MGASILIRETIHSSVASDRVIPLGIRAAVAGATAFRRQIFSTLKCDRDVTSVHELNGPYLGETICSLHILITESGTNWHKIPEIECVGLVAVVGQSLGDYALLPNAMLFPFPEGTHPQHTIKAIKEKAVEIRLQEFAGLLSAFVAGSETQRQNASDQLVIQLEGEEKGLSTSSIDWIRSAGNHVEIRAAGSSYVHRSEMHTLESSLPSSFVRIHRRVIVNLKKVVKIDRESTAKLFARFGDGIRFAISRHRRNEVEKRMREIRGYSL